MTDAENDWRNLTGTWNYIGHIYRETGELGLQVRHHLDSQAEQTEIEVQPCMRKGQ